MTLVAWPRALVSPRPGRPEDPEGAPLVASLGLLALPPLAPDRLDPPTAGALPAPLAPLAPEPPVAPLSPLAAEEAEESPPWDIRLPAGTACRMPARPGRLDAGPSCSRDEAGFVSCGVVSAMAVPAVSALDARTAAAAAPVARVRRLNTKAPFRQWIERLPGHLTRCANRRTLAHSL